MNFLQANRYYYFYHYGIMEQTKFTYFPLGKHLKNK